MGRLTWLRNWSGSSSFSVASGLEIQAKEEEEEAREGSNTNIISQEEEIKQVPTNEAVSEFSKSSKSVVNDSILCLLPIFLWPWKWTAFEIFLF